ncbi:hypothetical protein MNBD_GAMMA22-2469 [hydrothermal vent metagenome]|uniref:Uncharacterized protein n=1 Tax=hydrothermal vent metagenome TaxID=652676 RepID=A0A3B1AFV8_9ZZZZ
MNSRLKIFLSNMLSIMFIVSSIGCLAQADEQQSSIDDSDVEADDKVETLFGANVPNTSFDLYSSSILEAQNEISFVCVINSPYELRRFELKCDEAKYLDVKLADCCIEGDIWQAKAKVWDAKPNSAITVTPSKANQQSVAARVYNDGGTKLNPKQLTALIECSYKSGINQFPAAALFTAKSDGYCTMKDLGVKINM